MVRIELDRDWRFRKVGSGPWYPARVPGCVHTDLLANGLIEDPFYRDNEHALQWIENEDWEYETVIEADDRLLDNEGLELSFEGLDTYADVYLNDSLLLRTDNMFRRWRVPCGGHLWRGTNTLRISFRSPIEEALPVYRALGHELPGGSKVVTRKAGYHYGWDWAPRFVTSGIWRPAFLVAWDGARITDLQVFQSSLTGECATCSVTVEIESIVPQDCEVSISLGGTGDTGVTGCDVLEKDSRGTVRRTARLAPGTNEVALNLEIPDPILWWTHDLGGQFLYTVKAELRLAGATVDAAERRVGLRTIEVVAEPDEDGETFYFRLNGVPVFMKGANLIPLDCFLDRVTPERYEALVRDATLANMNMLRIWGGGIYENDRLYDLCDEHGILVWQDFMFACAMYPGTDTFLANVAHEARHNIRRLRNHPCIALWCGNNEIDEAWHNWGWQAGYNPAERATIRTGYEKLFLEILPGAVAAYDPGRFYWPSSPRFGRADPRSLTEGDAHYWGVWHDGEPFEVFDEKVGRFMSEYGFQSFPAFETVESFTLPTDRGIETAVMRSHQKHPRGNELILDYMNRYYRRPKDFTSFVYVSQLLQAEGIRRGIEAHRRATPYCMGSLYWQLNDCWPVASWSSIDYGGRWKALHYRVRELFEDVLLSVVEDGESISVHVVSDRLQTIAGTIEMQLLDFSGNLLWGDMVRVTVAERSSRSYARIAGITLLSGRDRRSLVFVASLYEGSSRVARSLHYFVPPKELELRAAAIQTEIHPVHHGYSIGLTTGKLAKNVYLSLEGAECSFSDNYFDLLPGEKILVSLVTEERHIDIPGRLRVTSLVDTYRVSSDRAPVPE
ncbi:MAG: glycoside hydrolase family 2 protein [bacterium]|nr:MAG: glycoside hydrolase family 2 protein [bacterium]